MIEYITTDLADTINADWSGTAAESERNQAIYKANVYLTNKALEIEADNIPTAVQVAGTELAKLALSESIFSDGREQVTSTSVTAGPVSTSKTYAVPLVAGHDALDYVNALLAPYMGLGTAVDITRTI